MKKKVLLTIMFFFLVSGLFFPFVYTRNWISSFEELKISEWLLFTSIEREIITKYDQLHKIVLNNDYWTTVIELENDKNSYMISFLNYFNLNSGSLSIIGEFENFFWKTFYLTYRGNGEIESYYKQYKMEKEWEHPFLFSLDPFSENFSSVDTACRRFNEEKLCLFVGKLKKRYIILNQPSKNQFLEVRVK